MCLPIIATIIILSITIMLLFAIRSGRHYTDRLNQKLAILLDDPRIDTTIPGGSLITGIYKSHSVAFAWFFPGWSSTGDSRMKLSIEIQGLQLSEFDQSCEEDQDNKSYNQDLLQGLSEIPSLEKIGFANQSLKVEMAWNRLYVGTTFPMEHFQPFGTLSPSLLSTDFIAAEVKKTLKLVFAVRK